MGAIDEYRLPKTDVMHIVTMRLDPAKRRPLPAAGLTGLRTLTDSAENRRKARQQLP